jgi:hypothetical protein
MRQSARIAAAELNADHEMTKVVQLCQDVLAKASVSQEI